MDEKLNMHFIPVLTREVISPLPTPETNKLQKLYLAK